MRFICHLKNTCEAMLHKGVLKKFLRLKSQTPAPRLKSQTPTPTITKRSGMGAAWLMPPNAANGQTGPGKGYGVALPRLLGRPPPCSSGIIGIQEDPNGNFHHLFRVTNLHPYTLPISRVSNFVCRRSSAESWVSQKWVGYRGVGRGSGISTKRSAVLTSLDFD